MNLTVDAIGITVSDMKKSLIFYTEVLSFKQVAQWQRSGSAYEKLTGLPNVEMLVVRLQLGDEFIELIEYITPHGRPIPADSQSNDHWFQHIAIIVKDMDKAYAQLCLHHVEHASISPQKLPDWNPNAAGIQAFYFRDPDGNHLEILQFPKNKGDAKWHKQTDQLFLGIDHTAIVVNDTDTSLQFYQDTLGLVIIGSSENYGIEQERLNNVKDARLRITTLKATSRPAIELLEYLTPNNGRTMPVDTSANDLWHWQIQMALPNIDKVETLLSTEKHHLISSSAIHGLMVRDPDGHALTFMAK